MEVLHREREAGRVPADLVQRHESVPAVKGRVLEPLRVHRRCRLLEAQHERVVPALLEEENPLELHREPRGANRLDVFGGDEISVGLDVGAVDRKRRERRSEIGLEGQLRGELLHLRGERRARLLQLRHGGMLGERPPITRERLIEASQRLLPRRVDEERSDVVQELVADRPLDRPVS